MMATSPKLPSDVKDLLVTQNFKFFTNQTISVFTSRTATVHRLCGSTLHSKASVGKVIQIYMKQTDAYPKERYLDGIIEVLKKLPKHPSLVEVYRAIHRKSLPVPSAANTVKSQLFLVSEFCPGGSLQELLLEEQTAPLSEDYIRSVYCQVGSALLFLHSLQLAHRNLKCSKVLFADEARTVVKLADGAIIRSCWPCQPRQPLLQVPSFCASAAFVAPEVLAQEMGAAVKRPYNAFRASVYSLGVILYATAHSGRLPFQEWSLRMLVERQQASSYELHRDRLSSGLAQLITDLLKPDPEKRLDISKLLKSPWCYGAAEEALTDE